MEENKFYKQAPNNWENIIHSEAKKIASYLNIDDSIPKFKKQQALITIKNHKDNFLNEPQFRLLNPTKNHIGRISKFLLEKACLYNRNALGNNQ